MMKYFHALVHKDADSAFGVEFPDLPGCFSAADRMKDVVPNACEALELWFEDADAVDPRPLEEVQTMVADQLAQAAFLLAVPYFTSSGKPVRANISIDKGALAAIDSAAASRKLTRSAFLAEAARNEIEGRH